MNSNWVLNDKKLKHVLLDSGFLVDYCENLLPEEKEWWLNMCKAQNQHTIEKVVEWGNEDCPHIYDLPFNGQRRECSYCWQSLLADVDGTQYH